MIVIVNKTKELGTPYYLIHFEIRDGSLLKGSGYVVTRKEWLTKPFSDLTDEELIVIVRSNFIL
jgi:hypothetical protein